MTQHRLYGLRGKAYGKARKQLFEKLKHQIAADHAEIVAAKGKWTAIDIGVLCRRYLIPVTIMCDWLYDLGLQRYDWEHLKDRGLTAKKIDVSWN